MVTLQYRTDIPKDTVDHIAKILNISTELATILVIRGITSYDEALHFFRPKLEDLYDPYLFDNMEAAVNLALDNIYKNILIYGDYDVDGTTSVALIYDFFRKHLYAKHLDYYVPDRQKEGYGVSIKAINEAIQNEVSLIITLDCGIKDFDAIKKAEDNGIKVIVIDHHEEDESKKHPASVVLNPKCYDCHYPFKELSGCGVAFKFVHAIIKKLSLDIEILYSYLDLVTLSTTCDLVPLVEENRIIVHYGLLKIKDNPRLGIKLLMGDVDKFIDIDVDYLVFNIGPQINASGRIDHASKSIELLINDDEEAAKYLAEEINFLNKQRQSMDREMVQEALKLLDGTKDEMSSIIYRSEWHPGLLGIVASKCIEHFYRPTIILSDKDGFITGSARSISCFSLYDALVQCSQYMIGFGGHEFAAGLRLRKDQLEDFKREFNKIVAEKLHKEDFVKKQTVDVEISFDKIDRKFLNILSQMGPFGRESMKPVFESIVTIKEFKIIKKEHLLLWVKQKGIHVKGIAFYMKDALSWLEIGSEVKIVYNIEKRNNNKFFQLIIKGIFPL